MLAASIASVCAAVSRDSACDDGECEHTHRGWLSDHSHKLVHVPWYSSYSTTVLLQFVLPIALTHGLFGLPGHEATHTTTRVVSTTWFVVYTMVRSSVIQRGVVEGPGWADPAV